MLFFGIKKTVRLNKKKTKEFPLGNSLVHIVIVCSLWLGALGWTCLAFTVGAHYKQDCFSLRFFSLANAFRSCLHD